MSDRQIVKQDFKLVNARYNLNTSEIKLIMNALADIKREDEDFKIYKISFTDLQNKLGIEQQPQRLKKFCLDLLSKPLFIPTNDKGDFLAANWFASLEYKNGILEYEISSKLKPYLLELKERFVQYNLKYILPLKSSYTIRLYQLLKEYEKLTRRTFNIEELREILQVPKSYLYADFKVKILRIAEREMIEHCDIFFEYEEIKERRKVVALLIRIKSNWDNIKPKEPQLFEAPKGKFERFIGKRINTDLGEKEIKLIEDFTDFIKVTLADGGACHLKTFEELESVVF